MKSIYTVLLLSLCVLQCFSQHAKSVEKKAPNILFIIADDMGKDATSGFPEGKIKPNTPHLNSIKNNGLTFNNFWVNPTCSPTRAAIITGKYGYRTNVIQVGNSLSPEETILQKYISTHTNNAYATALIGKWHLSGRDLSFNPESLGIDYFSGIMKGGTRDYYSWDLYENGSKSPQKKYITEKFTDLSIDWINEQTKPWFLWLAYTAPHTPFHAPPMEMHSQGDLSPYSRGDNTFPYYMAAIETMDYQIGRLLKSIPSKERENTIIIFIGDNGTPRRVSQAPYNKNTKGTLYQGGINTPMYVSGYGVTRTGIDNSLINNTDLFSTIAEVAGVDSSLIHDSKSFKPLFNKPQQHRDFIYTEMIEKGENLWTIRNSKFKLISGLSGPIKVFDLSIDPYETNNLINSPVPKELKSEIKKLETALNQIRD